MALFLRRDEISSQSAVYLNHQNLRLSYHLGRHRRVHGSPILGKVVLKIIQQLLIPSQILTAQGLCGNTGEARVNEGSVTGEDNHGTT